MQRPEEKASTDLSLRQERKRWSEQQKKGQYSLSPATLKAAQEAAEAEGEGVPVFTQAVETQAQRDALSRKLSSKMKGGGQ